MPLVRCIGGDTDNIIAVLPKSLSCGAYHGGTSDSGDGSGSISGITMSFSGSLTYSTSHSGDGSGSLTVTQNGTRTSISSGSRTVHFDEGDTFSFTIGVGSLGNWGRGSQSASFTWVAD